jgi:hypothetical protein
MRRNQRNMLLVGIIMMVIGIVIGVLAGEDLPIIGTVAPEKDKAETQASDNVERYYLVPLTDAETWLTDTYPDLADQLTTEIDTVQEITTMDDYRTFVSNKRPCSTVSSTAPKPPSLVWKM